MNKYLQTAITTATLVSMLCLTSNSFASGFAIIENSASGMGQAFAGAAAVAEDPSTIYFNPAGMMYLEGTQMTAGLHIINSTIQFKKDNYPSFHRGNEGGNAGATFFVPNFYWVRDFGEKYKIGLGVNTPFGLETEYKKNWMGEQQATNSELKSINFNPAIAFRANDKLTIGLGMNLQYMEATFENTGYIGIWGVESENKFSGDSWAFGFNAGFIYELTPATRIGVHYRSEISHTLEGNEKTTYTINFKGAEPFTSSIDAYVKIKTPSIFSISLTHAINDRLTLLGDISHTKWSNVKRLGVINTINESYSSVIHLREEKWDDSYRISLGMKYQYNDQWIFRTGIAHDETPINDRYRTFRIPDDDKLWLSFGASYSPNSNLTIDAGYSHAWVDDANIGNKRQLASIVNFRHIIGKYEADVDILSVQATYKF